MCGSGERYPGPHEHPWGIASDQFLYIYMLQLAQVIDSLASGQPSFMPRQIEANAPRCLALANEMMYKNLIKLHLNEPSKPNHNNKNKSWSNQDANAQAHALIFLQKI